MAGRLLNWFYERARTGGFDRVTLHVWADNGSAQRLYAGEGFVEAGRAAIPLARPPAARGRQHPAAAVGRLGLKRV
ncbi:GNAT family N-acetyltransferase [Azospirillum doebereinerae]|uniref:GNAT family N-acetyltransferase n=1 Tax=Azospirillum doebereinerae TaxID=92933 RepID=UPI00384FB10B